MSDLQNALKFLEQAAMDAAEDATLGVIISLSQAISLKRIADALQVPGPDPLSINLGDVISGIEQSMRGR